MGVQSVDTRVDVERLGFHWKLTPGGCIADALIDRGAWELDTTRAIVSFVRPGMHVVDVGANFGYFTLLLAKAVGPHGRVWAFEPSAAFRAQLEEHLALNGLADRVHVLPYGLSDRDASAEIAVGGASATLHWTGTEAPPRRETVQLHALDDVAEALGLARVDFVKIDLDGHEPRFLRGAHRTLQRHRPVLSIEFAQHCLHVAGSDVRTQAYALEHDGYVLCDERTRLPFPTEMEFLNVCGNFDRSAQVWALPAERITGVPTRIAANATEFRRALGLASAGVILEDDLDVVENECELYERKRRDAEVLCALASSRPGDCLDLGTSFGRSAFKLATNVGAHTVFTVNMLPEQAARSGEQITHVLGRDEIGSFLREHGVGNVEQIYANTLDWQVPDRLRDLAVVFVDACHDEEAVYRDSLAVWPRIAPGGYLAWHDFSPFFRERYPWIDSVMRGVERFVAECCPGATVVHLRQSWIGVVRKER